MKILIIASLLVSIYAVDIGNIQEVCNKQAQINSLIQQLTPSGQNATFSILKDIQILSSAAYRIILNKVKSQNAASFKRLMASDTNNMQKLIDMFTTSKSKSDLVDLCQAKKDEEMLVNNFANKNQASAKYFLKQINDKYSSILTNLANVVQNLNSDFVSQLMKNENMSLLASLAKLL